MPYLLYFLAKFCIADSTCPILRNCHTVRVIHRQNIKTGRTESCAVLTIFPKNFLGLSHNDLCIFPLSGMNCRINHKFLCRRRISHTQAPDFPVVICPANARQPGFSGVFAGNLTQISCHLCVVVFLILFTDNPRFFFYNNFNPALVFIRIFHLYEKVSRTLLFRRNTPVFIDTCNLFILYSKRQFLFGIVKRNCRLFLFP